MDAKEIIKKEWIGTQVKITDSKNKDNINIEGKIIDETQNMFTIRTQEGDKMVKKEDITLTTEMEGKMIDVEGNLLVGRPEDRIKAKVEA